MITQDFCKGKALSLSSTRIKLLNNWRTLEPCIQDFFMPYEKPWGFFQTTQWETALMIDLSHKPCSRQLMDLWRPPGSLWQLLFTFLEWLAVGTWRGLKKRYNGEFGECSWHARLRQSVPDKIPYSTQLFWMIFFTPAHSQKIWGGTQPKNIGL